MIEGDREQTLIRDVDTRSIALNYSPGELGVGRILRVQVAAAGASRTHLLTYEVRYNIVSRI